MMGNIDNKGIIPRLCDALFDRIAKKQSPELTFKVEVSYMEIYNEKVRTIDYHSIHFFVQIFTLFIYSGTRPLRSESQQAIFESTRTQCPRTLRRWVIATSRYIL